MKKRLFVITVLATSKDAAKHIAKNLADDLGSSLTAPGNVSAHNMHLSADFSGYGEAVEKPLNWFRRLLRWSGWL